MSYQRVQVDPLTIAYMAIGAHSEIKKAFGQCIPEWLSDQHGGQLGFIGDVVGHAQMLEECLHEQGDAYNGVFVYDIAEPFGEAYARSVFERRDMSAKDIARSLFQAAAAPPVQPG